MVLAQRPRVMAQDRKRTRIGPLAIAVFVVGFLVLMPVFPYSPQCGGKYHPTDLGSVVLSDAYRDELLAGLRSYDFTHVSVAGVVFLRLSEWLDRGDRIRNLSHITVLNLIDEDWRGEKINLPEHVALLIAETRARNDGVLEPDCDLVRAVAVEEW